MCPERCLRMTGRTARVTFIGPMRLAANCRSIYVLDRHMPGGTINRQPAPSRAAARPAKQLRLGGSKTPAARPRPGGFCSGGSGPPTSRLLGVRSLQQLHAIVSISHGAGGIRTHGRRLRADALLIVGCFKPAQPPLQTSRPNGPQPDRGPFVLLGAILGSSAMIPEFVSPRQSIHIF